MTRDFHDDQPVSFDSMMRSMTLSLKAERKSHHTIRQYSGATRSFHTWLEEQGDDAFFPDAITHRHVKAWLASMPESYKDSTVRHYYGGLRAFFAWYGEEEADDGWVNPMHKVRAPKVQETTKDIVTPADMQNVLRQLDRKKRLRDAAIVSLFCDTGMRRAEIERLYVGDVDLDEAAIVLAKTKNATVRTVPFSVATARRLDRYLRERKAKPKDPLFVSERGITTGAALTGNGIFQLIARIFKEHGFPGISPHDLRHSWATAFIENEDAREGDLQELGGWKSRAMVDRYTKTRRTHRAVAAHRRFSPLNQ